MSATVQPAIGAGAQVRVGLSGSEAWKRWLLPSISDILLVVMVCVLFVRADGWSALLRDADTGWHIRTGESILDTRTVPRTDPYSFSKAGEPWFAWEWASDVFYAALHRGFGLKAIVLFSGFAIAAAVTILFRLTLWSGANALVAMGTTLAATAAASVHFLARPHVWTLVFFVCALWMLHADRRRPSRRVWLLVPLTVAWVNLHGGWAALIACLGLLAVGSAIEVYLHGGTWRGPARYAALLAGCSAATLVNPYGAGLHLHVFAYLRSDWIRNFISEFQSPQFRTGAMTAFELVLLAGMVSVPMLLRSRRIAEALWMVYFAHMALESARHVPLFVFVAAPFVACQLSELWTRWVAGGNRRSLWQILDSLASDIGASSKRTSITLLAFPLLLAAMDRPAIDWPRDFPADVFPARMVEKHGDVLRQARVLTTDQWADYLIYRMHPHVKVFIDGRSDFFGSQIGDDYVALRSAAWNWPQLMERYQFQYALTPVDWPLASALKAAGWPVIADDGQAILFARPTNLTHGKQENGLMERTTAAEGTGERFQ